MSYIIAENTYLVHLEIIVDLCMRTVYWLSCRHKIFRILSNGLLQTYVLLIIGKKRAQCNVCLKTFCDKGALKIHFSAVHLREMHACSVEGKSKGIIWGTIWRNLVTILGTILVQYFWTIIKNNKIFIVS